MSPSRPPKALGPQTEPVDADGVDLDDRWGSILGSVLTGGVDLGSCAQVEVRGSVFRGVSFRADPGVELDITASRFVDCDLTALRFTKLTNTRFEGCKLSGIDLSAGLVRDVVFERTRLELSVLRMAELERVEFRDATIDDVDAYEAGLATCRCRGRRCGPSTSTRHASGRSICGVRSSGPGRNSAAAGGLTPA